MNRFALPPVCLLLSCLSASCSAADRPHVLFVAVDDMRCDAACYGHDTAITPSLDRLARSAVLFQRAYCQQALCNPSRASLLTGLRPDSLRIWNLTRGLRDARPEIVTLPQLFRQQGYFTQGIGKIFHNWRTALKGDPDSWSVPAQYHFARHDDDQPLLPGESPPDLATAPRCHRLAVPDTAYFDGRIAATAADVIRARATAPDAEPLFLAVGFWKPHLPFNAPARYWDMYERSEISLPKFAGKPDRAPAFAFHDSREILRAAGRQGLTLGQVRELRHGYLAGISYLDAQLGLLLDALEQTHMRDNTIIVFWSDHGFHLGENSLWCKTSNFERDARVPLLISLPDGRGAGQVCPVPVELVDLYPTLAELCGLPLPGETDGVSLVPLLNRPRQPLDRCAWTQHPRPAYYKGQPEVMGVSVRTAQMRYTEWRDFETGRVLAREAYDYQRGFGERENIVDELPADMLTKLQQRLCEKFPPGGYARRE
ncbi:MAG: sulfatase [Planctomycetaceae bacterium]|nr:sulfatase [Planctomycetaceae bacterium]